MSVYDPTGRTYLVWESQGGEQPYTELAAARPPRVVEWHADEHGCYLVVEIAGARDVGCPAGAPPPPPALPWGHVLP